MIKRAIKYPILPDIGDKVGIKGSHYFIKEVSVDNIDSRYFKITAENTFWGNEVYEIVYYGPGMSMYIYKDLTKILKQL